MRLSSVAPSRLFFGLQSRAGQPKAVGRAARFSSPGRLVFRAFHSTDQEGMLHLPCGGSRKKKKNSWSSPRGLFSRQIEQRTKYFVNFLLGRNLRKIEKQDFVAGCHVGLRRSIRLKQLSVPLGTARGHRNCSFCQPAGYSSGCSTFWGVNAL